MLGKILLIMRSAQHTQVLQDTLRARGHTVLIVQRALDGLDIARKQMPDLIVTEIYLPEMSGRELTTSLRAEKRFADIPILTILAADKTAERDQCIAAGMNGFLDDPLIPEVFPLLIEFFLSGGSSDVHMDTGRLDEARSRYMHDVVKGLEARIRELERKNSDLQRIDDMKDTFIQLTAHELRTPLTLVIGYTRLIEDYPSLRRVMQNDPGFIPLMQGLTDSITRMQLIIEDLLTTSRIMTRKIELNMSQISLATVIRHVLGTYQEALRERRQYIYFDPSEFPETIRADEGLVQQMISNLLSNAIKYTPDGGNIYFQCEVTGSAVRLSIRDTGIGINADNHERIFGRMNIGGDIMQHTTSKTTYLGGGLGLGLAICKGIVEAHGGKIWVESSGYDPQRMPGSEFVVVMPLAAAPSTKPMPRIKRLDSNPRKPLL